MKVSGAVRVTALRTMILLDPDLSLPGDPSQETPQTERQGRMPSARSLSRFLREAQAAVRQRGAVSVLLTTDREIRRLNRMFRGKNKTTDVLSFPAAPVAAGQRVGKSASRLVGPRVCGDLAISVETARRQSIAYGHSLGIELKTLILHGLLHLAGYDHETDDGEMAQRERLLRARLGLSLGLIERAAKSSSKGTAGRRASRTPGPSTTTRAYGRGFAQDGRA